MTAFEAIQHSIAPELGQLNERIASALGSSNSMMNGIVEQYLRTKGKQIRPIMVMLSARLFGSVTPKVISAAAAVEMLHNASLIHDDVVDESKLRRSTPTINAIWDNHIAVLSGDFFVSTALQLAISTDDIRIVGALANLGRLLSMGELDQIYTARFRKLDEKAYFEIIGRKTASLFEACVEMGCYAVNVDGERLEALRKFSRLLGLCFQIKDDIFDYYEDKTIGKPTGNDLREGKITLPLLWVLLQENAPDHAEMLELSRREELSTDEISILIDYAKANGGIDYAYTVMTRFREEAASIMEQFPDSETKNDFMALFDYIITRNH
ncbi:MAG: polyprenyl synthetase family protein [Muribaculaceae bacterium]|nr:polyprenyl synthetase family protein [Muribaculaceae bacterium]